MSELRTVIISLLVALLLAFGVCAATCYLALWQEDPAQHAILEAGRAQQ